MKKILPLIVIFTLILTINDAFAYIRPGSGNDIAQIIISAIVSIITFFKNITAKIKSIFTGKK